MSSTLTSRSSKLAFPSSTQLNSVLDSTSMPVVNAPFLGTSRKTLHPAHITTILARSRLLSASPLVASRQRNNGHGLLAKVLIDQCSELASMKVHCIPQAVNMDLLVEPLPCPSYPILFPLMCGRLLWSPYVFGGTHHRNRYTPIEFKVVTEL